MENMEFWIKNKYLRNDNQQKRKKTHRAELSQAQVLVHYIDAKILLSSLIATNHWALLVKWLTTTISHCALIASNHHHVFFILYKKTISLYKKRKQKINLIPKTLTHLKMIFPRNLFYWALSFFSKVVPKYLTDIPMRLIWLNIFVEILLHSWGKVRKLCKERIFMRK